MFKATLPRRGLLSLGAFAAAGSLAAPTILRAQTTAVATIADTLASDTRFERLIDLISRGSMVEDFRQAQPMTLFAPTDAAFAGAPSGLLADLSGTSASSGQQEQRVDRVRLGALLGYLVVPGLYRAADLVGPQRRLRTKNGSDVVVTTSGNVISLQNPAPGQQAGGFRAAGINVSSEPARIIQADILASNGVIHAIDQIVWP